MAGGLEPHYRDGRREICARRRGSWGRPRPGTRSCGFPVGPRSAWLGRGGATLRASPSSSSRRRSGARSGSRVTVFPCSAAAGVRRPVDRRGRGSRAARARRRPWVAPGPEPAFAGPRWRFCHSWIELGHQGKVVDDPGAAEPSTRRREPPRHGVVKPGRTDARRPGPCPVARPPGPPSRPRAGGDATSMLVDPMARSTLAISSDASSRVKAAVGRR